jgi:hypothetical protein
VGDDEDTPPKVRRTDIGSGERVPLRIVPDFGKGPEYVEQPSNSERCDVLHDDESWSNLAYESIPLPPEG